LRFLTLAKYSKKLEETSSKNQMVEPLASLLKEAEVNGINYRVEMAAQELMFSGTKFQGIFYFFNTRR
jgi:hypothetical protein